MGTKQEYNRRINQLYRQLGKEVYEDNKDKKVNRKQKKLIKLIDHNIMLVNRLDDEGEDKEVAEEMIILEPEANGDGIMVYKFCPHCHTGNNPNSTHCIKCHKELK